MAASSPKILLSKLGEASSPTTRLHALKKIKYDLTGHVSRKIAYLQHGLVIKLADILFYVRTGATSGAFINDDQLLGQEEIATLTQVAHILCVIAHEGPAFAKLLLDTPIVDYLLSFLHRPLPHATILSLLRSLNAVAFNLPPSYPTRWPQSRRFANLLYSRRHIRCFSDVLGSANETTVSQQACNSILGLLCKTLVQDKHKRALVNCGVLDLLCARLAGFVVAEGLVPPGTEAALHGNGTFPSPVPKCAHLSPVLEAICILTEESRPRTKTFLSNATLRAVLPSSREDFSPSDIRQAPWGASYFSGGAVPRSRLQGPFESLLPLAPINSGSNTALPGFPPLSSVEALQRKKPSFMPATAELPGVPPSQEAVAEVDDSAIISWLLYITRESRATRRFLAIRLLTNLHTLNFVKGDRSLSFTALLVPLLTRMLEAEVKHLHSSITPADYLSTGTHYIVEVPAVLAALFMDNPWMQRVAVESHAITNLCICLKSTFVPGRPKVSPWQPRKTSSLIEDTLMVNEPLGHGGPLNTDRYIMRFREGCLKALATIAATDEDYRGLITNECYLPHVVTCLKVYHSERDADRQWKSDGSPASVVLAACALLTAVGRSQKEIRTKLIEAEVAKPVFDLLFTKDPELRIAATKVFSNLVMDFGAVRETVDETALIKKLCEQAHSAHARLRRESLWALKALAPGVPKRTKMDIVNELGCSWIKLLVRTNPIDVPDGEVIGLVERDYPQLTTYQRPTANGLDDIVMDDNTDDDSDDTESTISEGSEFDDNYLFDTKHTVDEDVEIQAQLLDMLRNLFCGDGASDVVRYVLEEMGQDDFFRIMLDRLRSRQLAGPTRRENHIVPPPAIIIANVQYIILHIAACDIRYRNFVASQQALLKQLVSFCTHASREVRANCCWLAINFTIEDTPGDRGGCRQRAVEIQKAGIVPHLRKMESSDVDQNVRERAKSALHLVTNLKLMA